MKLQPPATDPITGTSGNARLRFRLKAAVALASLLSCTTLAAAVDIDALLERLARPAPATIRYTEVRFSSLLTAPLVVSGELAYLGPGVLERRVEEPFRETTTIRGEDVAVSRESAPPTRFSLKRAPELRSMLGAFGALLAGNRAMLEQAFTFGIEGDDTRWRINLTPRDAKVRARLEVVRVDGARDQPRCLTLVEPDGDADFMLLGDTAGSLPATLDQSSLAARCAEGH